MWAVNSSIIAELTGFGDITLSQINLQYYVNFLQLSVQISQLASGIMLPCIGTDC
jgi:hypothetical protein